jgi:alkylated DNA repair dioxygenase AlkB
LNAPRRYREGVPAALVPDATVERIELDEASWVDVVRGFVAEPGEVFDAVHAGTRWTQNRLYRYDHVVDEQRLGAGWRVGQPVAHPLLLEVHRHLQAAYGKRFDSFAFALYRDGHDGQAFHRDRDMRWLDDTIIALLTLGARRPWHLRPRAHRHDHGAWEGGAKGATHDLSPAAGDLIVMGGATQVGWEHSVPYLGGRPVEPRISVQWRWTSGTGRPVQGPSYRAPRTYSRR